MASPQNRMWPKVSKYHYGMYAAWLGKYGLSQTGVSVTNTNMMEELGLENTKENRKWVSNKFRRANPRCSHYCEDTYLAIYEATSKTTDVDKKREEQSQVVDASQAVLHNLLALLTNETLTPDFFEELSNADILKFLIKVVEAQGKNSEFTAKLYGIFTKKIQIFDTSEGDADVGGISALPALEDIGEKVEEKDRSKSSGIS